MKKLVLVGICLAFMSAACTHGYYYNPNPALVKSQRDDRFGTRYIAHEIYRNLRVKSMANLPVIVTTFVNLNDLEKTSVFGRMMAEKLLNEMSREGFDVVEVRRAQDVFIKEGVGETILTRDMKEIDNKMKARTVLAGTYVVTSRAVIVNARLIDIRTPQILSTVSFEVGMTEEIENLLRGVEPF